MEPLVIQQRSYMATIMNHTDECIFLLAVPLIHTGNSTHYEIRFFPLRRVFTCTYLFVSLFIASQSGLGGFISVLLLQIHRKFPSRMLVQDYGAP